MGKCKDKFVGSHGKCKHTESMLVEMVAFFSAELDAQAEEITELKKKISLNENYNEGT